MGSVDFGKTCHYALILEENCCGERIMFLVNPGVKQKAIGILPYKVLYSSRFYFKKIQNILKIAEFALKLTRNQAESYDT